MRHRLIQVLAFAVPLLVARTLPALEHDSKPDGTEYSRLFQAVPPLDSTCVTPGFHPHVINGTKASRADYPAVFYAAVRYRGRCSATLVGPRVLLTAAHCVDDQPTPVEIKLPDGRRIAGICNRADDYGPSRPDVDLALCRMVEPVADIELEPLHIDAAGVNAGHWVRLTGYGCCSDMSEGFGILRAGDAVLTSVPTADSSYCEVHGPALLCDDDSGGPTYLLSPRSRSPSPDEPRGPIIGVNYWTDLGKGISRIASVSSEPGLRFIRNWASRPENSDATICGYHAAVAGCRVLPALTMHQNPFRWNVHPLVTTVHGSLGRGLMRWYAFARRFVNHNELGAYYDPLSFATRLRRLVILAEQRQLPFFAENSL